jgi:hypothetical protein
MMYRIFCKPLSFGFRAERLHLGFGFSHINMRYGLGLGQGVGLVLGMRVTTAIIPGLSIKGGSRGIIG